MTGQVLAVSDLHVAYPENQQLLDSGLHPTDPDDWLIVAGDVAERAQDVERALATLAQRFARVVWVPGNHELWTHPKDPVTLRGVARYERLVEFCRGLGNVSTPEDEFPVWTGDGEPVVLAPLFLLYDYTFRTDPGLTRQGALDKAREAGVVCADEHVLFPDPYASRDQWCHDRVRYSAQRLDDAVAAHPGTRLVLINHWPVHRHPCDVLYYPDFALWCGTVLTDDWHVRWPVAEVVYGHLHIPRVTERDGVRFHEVSLGYPREWSAREAGPQLARPVWPITS